MYSQFSEVYDSLMGDVNYTARTNYLKTLFLKFDKMPTLMLDLACGTGGFSNEFSKSQVQVIGVDMSPEMLSAARENSAKMGTDVLYLCQKANELDLYGTVDGAICCLDSLNHITDVNELSEAFSKVSLFLEKDRLFIFDLNTVYKHKTVLGDNTFVFEENGVFCVWDNSFDENTNTVAINLDFFEETDDGKYNRFSDYIEEKAYKDEEITKLLEDNGFKVEALYDDLSENPPNDNSERIIYVARKVAD